MTLLCFLLDSRTIPPSLLRDLKQCLLQLANLYAVARTGSGGILGVEGDFRTLADKIALCYILRNRNSNSDEVKISYVPTGNFNLRSFHHAVNNLPSECSPTEFNGSDHGGISTPDVFLSRVISDGSLFLRNDKDIMKKVICVGCSLISNSDALRKTLAEAAEKCISVEFLILGSDRFHGFSAELEKLMNSITDMENCTLQSFVPNAYILSGLVKKWFQDVINDAEEPTQAILHFKTAIVGTTNKIFCNISPTCKISLEDIKQCRACRCHCLPATNSVRGAGKVPQFCRASGRALEAGDLIEHGLTVGGQTLLHLPSFHDFFPQLSRKILNSANFHVIERTKLASLDEGAVLGGSHVVVPGASPESEPGSDEFDGGDLNNQAFYGLSRCLFLSDEGLICTSTCDTETMTTCLLQGFYLLLPSAHGPMLLRRLAGSEEIWPTPDTGDVALPEDLLRSIQTSLSKVDLREYNPLHHDRGFHQRLNSLVRESLHLGSISDTVEEPGQLEEDPSASEEQPENDKTSRILERLDTPGPRTGMGILPTILTSRAQKAHGPPSSAGPIQPLRPIFQRLKRAPL